MFQFPSVADRVLADQKLIDAASRLAVTLTAAGKYPIEVARGFIAGRMISLGIELYLRAGISREKIEETVLDFVRHA